MSVVTFRGKTVELRWTRPRRLTPGEKDRANYDGSGLAVRRAERAVAVEIARALTLDDFGRAERAVEIAHALTLDDFGGRSDALGG